MFLSHHLISVVVWEATVLLSKALGISVQLSRNLKNNRCTFVLITGIFVHHQISSPWSSYSPPHTYTRTVTYDMHFVYNNPCFLFSEISLDSYFCAGYNLNFIVSTSFISESFSQNVPSPSSVPETNSPLTTLLLWSLLIISHLLVSEVMLPFSRLSLLLLQIFLVLSYK